MSNQHTTNIPLQRLHLVEMASSTSSIDTQLASVVRAERIRACSISVFWCHSIPSVGRVKVIVLTYGLLVSQHTEVGRVKVIVLLCLKEKPFCAYHLKQWANGIRI